MTVQKGQDPDNPKWKWVIVGCGFFLGFLTDGIRFSFGLTYKEWLVDFNYGKGLTAGIGSLMFAMVNVAAPFASFLINKYGYRVTTILGAVIYAVGLIASSLTSNFYLLYVSFGIICGIGFSFLYIPISISILQYFDEDKKSLANGIAMCGSGLGGFAFNPLLNSLFDTYTWRGALLVCAGIVLHGAVAGALMRPVKEIKDKLNDTSHGNYNEPVNSGKNKGIVTHKQTEIFATDNTLKSWPIGQYKQTDNVYDSIYTIYTFGNKDAVTAGIVLDEASNNGDNLGDNLEMSTSDKTNTCISEHVNEDFKHFQLENIVTGSERRASNLAGNNDNTECNKETKEKKGWFAWYILKDPRFLLFMVSQFFFAVAYMIPFTYLPDIVISLGYSREKAVWLMSSISIVSTVSRVASGWLADRNFINRRVLYCVANFMCALSVLSLFFWRHYTLIMIASLAFAATAGCIIATVAVVVSDLFGSKLLSEAYGLSIFGRAPGNLSGPPFSGWIVDQTGRLELVFVVSGVAFAVGGVFIVLSVKCKDRLRFGEIAQS